MDLNGIIGLMKQKKEELEQFQELTQAMLLCTREELETQVRQREKSIRQIEKLDQQLQQIREDLAPEDPVRQAMAGTLEGNGHPEPVEEIFTLSRQIRALLGRIREDDIQASLRLRVEQEKILSQIRTANQGGKAKAARFYSAAAAARSRGGSRFGNA